MEVDTEVILAMQRQINELRGQVESLEYFKSQHMGTDAGQSGFNYPHPNQKVLVAEYGGGIMRLDTIALQVKATNLINGILFVEQFLNASPSLTDVYTGLSSSINTTNNYIKLMAQEASGAQAYLVIDVFNRQVQLTNGGPLIKITGNSAAGTSKLDLSNVGTQLMQLRLGMDTADPSTPLDGSIWYRSDTDKPRFRANGVTESLAFESWVTTNAGTATDYAHSLMLMGA